MADLEHKLLDSQDLYRTDRMALRGEIYRLPDGRTSGQYRVLDYPDWVNALALTKDGQAVLVRQFRPGPKKVTLELPGGAVEPEEQSLAVALRRELEEETGYGGGELAYLASLSPNSASHTNRTHSFLATGVERIGDLRPDENEFLEVVLMPLREVVETALEGGLDQAMHVATVFLAVARLGLVDRGDLRGLALTMG
jgi:8-oxo-dGTP pyrophosphatase MutT (NUDIX family)